MLFEQGGDAFGVYVRQQSQRKVGLTADLFAELRSQLRGRARIEIGLDLFGRRPASLEEELQPLDVAAVKIHKTRVVQGRTQELPGQRYSPFKTGPRGPILRSIALAHSLDRPDGQLIRNVCTPSTFNPVHFTFSANSCVRLRLTDEMLTVPSATKRIGNAQWYSKPISKVFAWSPQPIAYFAKPKAGVGDRCHAKPRLPFSALVIRLQGPILSGLPVSPDDWGGDAPPAAGGRDGG